MPGGARFDAPPAATPSPDEYRRLLWSLTCQANDALAAGLTERVRAITGALNSITKASIADRQLEELSKLHATIRDLTSQLEQLNNTRADERHQAAARIDDDGTDNTGAAVDAGGWPADAGVC